MTILKVLTAFLKRILNNILKEKHKYFITKKEAFTEALSLKYSEFKQLPKINRSQDSMVLAQKQKYRSIEQDTKPGNKPMHIWSPYFLQRRQEYTMEKRQPLQ